MDVTHTAFFRRFCQHTASLFPSFALGYRLLNSELVERFILGKECQQQNNATLGRAFEGVSEKSPTVFS